LATFQDGAGSFEMVYCWSIATHHISLESINTQKKIVLFVGHAMGFWHEQSRPDRDQFVTIVWDNIPERELKLSPHPTPPHTFSIDKRILIGIFFSLLIHSARRHNFNKYNRTQVDSLGVRYDYLAIMHYSKTAFSSTGQATIVPTDPKAIQLGQRVGLSPMDVKQADLLYKCNGIYSLLF
jgi:meprin B